MQESNSFCTNYLTKFSVDMMEFGKLLRLVSVMNLKLVFILSIQYSKKRTLLLLFHLERFH